MPRPGTPAGRFPLAAMVAVGLGLVAFFAGTLLSGVAALAAYLAGALLVMGSALAFARALRREPAEPAPPRADLTFGGSVRHDVPAPLRNAHARAPKATAVESLSAEEIELHRLEEEIKDLNRRINRAGVMLGTGRLSNEGYARYIAELREKRGELEAERTRRQLSHDSLM